MTDKQIPNERRQYEYKSVYPEKSIIIDDIDVSGCEYYFDEKCRCMDASIMQDFYLCTQCNSNPNCHYKLYKRKEQECEELKETLKTKAKGHGV